MSRILLSNLRPEDEPGVVCVLEALREIGHVALPVRAQIAALALLPAQELRAEVREILDLRDAESPRFGEVGR
jgi:hypothetical protein